MENAGCGKINHLTTPGELTGKYGMKYAEEGWEMKKSGKGKICWMTACEPVSLLHCFDNLRIFLPEIEGINCGVMGEAVKWQMIAEAKGYSRDLCSYARAQMGRMFGGAGEAEGSYPPPDFLLTSRMNCHTYIHWWEALARHYKVPLIVLDGPNWDRPMSEPIPRHYEEYWGNRTKELIAFLEEQTGQKFDYDRYKENIVREMEAHKLFDEIHRYCQRVPTPVTDFDLLPAHLAVAWWRGTSVPLDILKEVKTALDERVAKGITAIANEKHRVMMMSNPPWFKLDMLPDWLAEVDAVIVASLSNRYIVQWSDVQGPNFEEVLRCYTKQALNLNIEERIIWAEGLVRDFKADCMAMMDNRGCKVIAFPVLEMMDELEKRLKIPCFRFAGNMNDPRDFNESEVRSQFETFIELLEQH